MKKSHDEIIEYAKQEVQELDRRMAMSERERVLDDLKSLLKSLWRRIWKKEEK